jgi:hypothetical protein
LHLSTSEVIEVPSVKVTRAPAVGHLLCCGVVLEIVRCACGNVSVQLNVESQLVIVHLRGLQETANLHSPLTLLFLGLGRCLLALLCKQLGVVARELLE